MLTAEPYQVLADCPHCLTEAAVVLLMDPLHPACHMGSPSIRRCRMCSWEERAQEELFSPRFPVSSGRCPNCVKPLSEAARHGEKPCPSCDYQATVVTIQEPTSLVDPTTAREAVIRWSTEDGEDDSNAFCESNMGASIDDVVRRLTEGQTIHTSFDVIAYLFPGGGGGGGGGGPATDPDRRIIETRQPISERETEPEPEPLRMDPRAPARVLVSVMCADGRLRPGEERFVASWLEKEDLPPLQPSDIRVWRPMEIGPMPDREVREKLLEAAVHLMHLDREKDGSEYKVVRAFAAAWGISDSQLREWDKHYDRRYAPTMTKLWRSLSTLISSPSERH